MAESHIFFDGIDEASIEKVKPSLMRVGATIELFYGNKVTHVITRRPLDGTLSDLLVKAKQRGIKVWSYDKLNRFMFNLLGPVKTSTTAAPRLSHLLREEKLVGPTDRDPHTRREDYHYFAGPYVMVWDPTHHYRPYMIKEYPRLDDPNAGDWPRFKSSSFGRCPFVEDPPRAAQDRQFHVEEAYQRKVDRERKRKAAILDETENSTRKVVVTEESMGPVVGSAVNSLEDAMRPHSDVFRPGQRPLMRSAASISHRFHEIVASGVNMSNYTSAVRSVALSGDHGGIGGNGLNPVLAQVPSREVNNLKRKVLDREKAVARVTVKQQQQRQQQQQASATEKKESSASKDLKPGFCENCEEKFEDFAEHIESKKHRKFASDGRQFAKLDLLLSGLQRPLKRMT